MSKKWSEQELEYLANNAGLLNHKELSSRLNRTISAIKIQQHKHGIRFLDNIYTYTMLSNELGKSRAIIRKWVNRGWIICRRANWKTYYGKYPMIFIEESIVKFLSKYYYLFDYRKVPNKYFSNLVSQGHENCRKRENKCDSGSSRELSGREQAGAEKG